VIVSRLSAEKACSRQRHWYELVLSARPASRCQRVRPVQRRRPNAQPTALVRTTSAAWVASASRTGRRVR